MSQNHHRARPPSAELYEEMNLEVSFAFYEDRFADASDFTFVFVGSFDLDEIRPFIQTYLGGLPSTRREETWQDIGIEPPTGVVRKVVYKGIEPKSQTQIVFTGPFEWNRQNRYEMTAMIDVLRINLREVLREDMGGTYGVRVSSSTNRDPRERYSVSIAFGTDPDRLEELVEAVFVQIDSLKQFGPAQEDVDKVKEQQRRSRETSLRRNGYWLAQLVAYDRYELVDALEPEMVQSTAERYLNTDNYVQVTLFPEKQEENP
jgi:zinc protease